MENKHTHIISWLNGDCVLCFGRGERKITKTMKEAK